ELPLQPAAEGGGPGLLTAGRADEAAVPGPRGAGRRGRGRGVPHPPGVAAGARLGSRAGARPGRGHFLLLRAAASLLARFIAPSIVTDLPSAFLLCSAATMNATSSIVSSAGTGALPVRKNVPISRTRPW